MKRQFKLLFFFCVFSTLIKSQCVQLLNDLVPQPNDSVLWVSLRVYVFLPSSNANTSSWTHFNAPTTTADIQEAIDTANYVYSTVTPPTLNPPGGAAPLVSHSKIQFRLIQTPQFIVDDGIYNGSTRLEDINDINSLMLYNDPNAINVYLIGYDPNDGIIGVPGLPYNETPNVYPSNKIIFHPQIGNNYSNCDNFKHYGRTLAHEAGHVMGLFHATGRPSNCTAEPWSYIYPNFGSCAIAASNDYYRGVYNCGMAPNYGCSSSYENNMMGEIGCMKNISPHQMAVMHFNLRTTQKFFLSQPSQTASTTRNPSFDYDVTSNESWTTDRYFKGNVTVKTGVTLSVTCGVAFTKGAGLIVENGAQLIVNGGTLTNISGRTWEGIFVGGNLQSQLVTLQSNPGACLNNGIVRISNNGTISHAYRGIRNFFPGSSSGSGVVFAQNANFINNRHDVYFQYGCPNYVSWFSNCNFITNNSSRIGDNFDPSAHVELTSIDGMLFRGCRFEYAALAMYNFKGVGIRSSNSRYVVENNGILNSKFLNMDFGIVASHSNPLAILTARYCEFIDNRQYGALLSSHVSNVLEQNYFRLPGPYAVGLYLQHCRYYNTKNNVFEGTNGYKTCNGINVFRSASGAHQIFRNSFSGLRIGINCMDNNSSQMNVDPGSSLTGLKMNCNKFNNTPNNVFDIAMTRTTGLAMPSVKQIQGQTSGFPASEDLVRNLYGANCTFVDWSNHGNMWFVHTTSTVNIQHGSNSNTITSVTQPTPNIPNPVCGSTILTVADMDIPLNYSEDCPGSPPSSGGAGSGMGSKLPNLNNYIASLKTNTSTTNDNLFEIQAAVSSKVNLFLSDTTYSHYNDNLDSVIAIYASNQGEMDDADILEVFAYLLKKDYLTAQTKVDALSLHRTDWAQLLSRIIEIEQRENGIFSLNDSTYVNDKNFLITYASTDNIDGQNIAQNLLLTACGIDYYIPHAFPESEESGQRKKQPIAGEKDAIGSSEEIYSIFPNPSSSTINVRSNQAISFSALLKDLSGRLLIGDLKSKGHDLEIDLNHLPAGIYLLEIIDNDSGKTVRKIIKH